MTKEKQKDGITKAYGSRPGNAQSVPVAEPEPMAQGIELSDIIYKPRTFFRLNPANAIFRALKSEQYFDDLERDIREAGQIIEALIAMPDGLILSGESRWVVADGLDAEGVPGFDRLPVRLVLSPMSQEEQERRLYLANLSRFELDEDTRLLLYAKVWPGYFRPESEGDDTVSPPTKAEIAKTTGKSERQIARDRGVMEEADRKAASEGREPTPADVKAARERKNAERREKPSATPVSAAIIALRKVLESLRDEADTLRMGESERNTAKGDGILHAVKKIEEALR